MRIPLRVKRLFPGVERLFPLAHLIIIAPRAYAMIEAVVDTGSPRTCVAPRDMEKMRSIRIETLPPSSPRYPGIGGFRFPAHSLKNVRLTFWDEKRNPVRIELQAIDVLGYPARDLERIKYIPTILGTDFLEDNGFALYFNPRDKIAYLEKT